MTVRWIGGAPTARARPAGSTAWTNVVGTALRSTQTAANIAGTINEATFTSLAPGTEYEYQVTPTDTSPVRSFRTAPLAGGFEVAFVADTGVIGRTDGLTTGTRQVIDEIAAADPLLVLGAGDFVSFDTDDRYDRLGDSIDAWLRQMEPITARSAFMPAYGNHEALLGEDLGQWVDRFATPAGTLDRSSYSFDVGGVHFVSLLGVQSAVDDTTEAWLVTDLDAAVSAGATRIVPFLHRNLYGAGTVHPPSPSLARQLSRIFEQYPVDIVLTAHDQSYERTFPLTGGTPTSSSRQCYTPDDGITYIKTSPGGKLSNVSWDFSGYSQTPPDPTIATREGGLHHYTILTVGETGDLTATTYGVTGNGSAAIVVDTVRYAESCPADVSFSTLPQRFDVDETMSTPITFDAQLVGADTAVAVTVGAPWLSASEPSADGVVAVTVDPTGLSPGLHAADVRVRAADNGTAVLPVVVDVRGTDSIAPILAYEAPDRSSPVLLDGATLRGVAYVGIPGDRTPIAEALFLVDDVPIRTDRGFPFDLFGGSRAGADPWDTSVLELGPHTIEAIIVGPDGTSTTAVARFTVVDARADTPTLSGEAYVPPTTLPSTPATQPDGETGQVIVPPVAVSTLPPVTFGSIDVGESPDDGGSWLTSWVTLAIAVALVGLAFGAIGSRLRSRPDDDRAAAGDAEDEPTPAEH